MGRVMARQILHGVQSHFPARAGEWALAAMLIDWGCRLLRHDIIFDNAPAFRQMASIFAENTWGWIAVTVGFLRIVSLIVNGTFPHTWYGRWSPHVRCAMSFLSVGCWSLIALGIAKSGINSTGLSIYPYLAAFDIWNAYRASQDAAKMDRALLDGRRIAGRA